MNPAIRDFLRAAADGDTGRVRAFLVQGADVNSTNAAGQTALILAAAFQHIEVVELLLKAKANIEHQDELGLTALDWAKPSPQIQALLRLKPDPVVEQIPMVQPLLEPEPEIDAPAPPPAPAPAPDPVPQLPRGLRFDTPNTPVQQTPVQQTPVQPPPMRTGEEHALRGLAAAILRDHKPKHVESMYEATDSEPEQVAVADDVSPVIAFDAPTPSYEPEPVEPIETNDDTLGRGRAEPGDDTLARKIQLPSTARIFDFNAPEEPVRPLSKVQVNVPQANKSSRNAALLWVFVILVLAAGGYGGYRVATSLLSSRTEAANTPAPDASPVVVQPPTASKRAPVVSGDFVGAELYVPDAEYPSGATVKDGTVTVEIRVNRKGIVTGARAVDGDESLQTAAEEAARSSAFSPEKLEDKPAFMTGTITYHFNSSFKASENNDSNNSEVSATSGGPLAGTELKLVQPNTPSGFSDTEVDDKVTIVVRVNRSGKVVSWRALNGAQELRAVAVRAAKQSTFSPDKLPDTGDVVGTITYNFH